MLIPSVLARQNGIQFTVVDCGVKHDFLAGLADGATHPVLLMRKAAGAEHGTADAASQAAMTATQRDEAIENGRAMVKRLPGNAFLLGEMGIGNTSAASMLLSRLAGLDLAVCTEAGTGLDDAAIVRKTDILREVLALHTQATAPASAVLR